MYKRILCCGRHPCVRNVRPVGERRRQRCRREQKRNAERRLESVGRLAQRNNTPVGHNIPTEWEVGEFDYRTGDWDSANAKNIKWVARLGSQTYGNPVVADGKVFVGTNNSGGWLKRYPADVDLGCCSLRRQGRQVSLAAQQRKAADRPRARLAAAGHLQRRARRRRRLWFVTSRGEVALPRHRRLSRRRERRRRQE